MSQYAGRLHARTLINHSSLPKLSAAISNSTTASTNSNGRFSRKTFTNYLVTGSCSDALAKQQIGDHWSNGRSVECRAARRRMVRYEEGDESDDQADERYGYNEDIAMLELYSQSARGEALIVKAMVDDQEEEVLIFKGFSSCLSDVTASDPSKSVLPARAVIKSIDRIRGPFSPSNVEYIEKGLTWETFRSRIRPN